MSCILDQKALEEEVDNYSLFELITKVGSILEIDTIYSLGALTGRLRDSLPDLAYMYNTMLTCTALVSRLAKEISSLQHSIDKTQALYKQYYDILKYKRSLALYLKDLEVIDLISLDHEQRRIAELQGDTANNLKLSIQEDA
tara:strand:+ start:518 stop:943 length:426 start_codon:yes stop_codon:yes gene_type:complete